MTSLIPIIILSVVLILIAVRKIGRINFRIWQIMTLGALSVLLTMQITLIDAFKAINFDVIFFLFGMFIIGEALEQSGYLSHMSYHFFKKAKNVDALILMILFGAGLASAFLMNDTLAIIGTPVVLLLARKHRMSAKMLLITLAFAVTIGSVLSPIGNPQNLLIALSGNASGNLQLPFITFIKYLFIPTVINLFIAYLLIKLFYKNEFHNGNLDYDEEPIKDKDLANLCKISLMIVAIMIIAKLSIFLLKLNFDFKLTYIALVGAIPIILFSNKRIEIIKKTDHYTLIFFASMFIMMQSVWNTGFFQEIIESSGMNLTSLVMIFIVSVLLSQLISNVPLVALYLPILISAGASSKELMALAAGSTIAGNMLILGAASNVIIIQNAERYAEKSGDQESTITFWEFAKIGIPLTMINVLVYYLYFSFV